MLTSTAYVSVGDQHPLLVTVSGGRTPSQTVRVRGAEAEMCTNPVLAAAMKVLEHRVWPLQSQAALVKWGVEDLEVLLNHYTGVNACTHKSQAVVRGSE